MQNEKPTKIYKSGQTTTNKSAKGSKKPNKPAKNPFEGLIKEFSAIIEKAKSGSKQHIAIIACALVLCVAVVAGVVFAVSGIGNSNPQSSSVSEIEVDPEADNNYNKDEVAIDLDKLSATVLPETEDAGQDYIDGTLFIGDSNTVRSLMYDVTGTTWNNVMGAIGLGIEHIISSPEKVVSFVGMEPVDIPTAVAMTQPQRIIITFGTNDALWDAATFIKEYKKAVNAIYDAYPYSDIIVNAVPPVDRQRPGYNHITMQQIDKFNAALAEMCDEEGWKFLNSAEALKDETSGFAKTDYTIEDGIHLSKKGFDALFTYIRTHAFETEDRRPEIKYCPKRNEKEMPSIVEDPIAIRERVVVKFVSDDYELGTVDGEVEQTMRPTSTTTEVEAKPKTENGGIFVGWECEHNGISDRKEAKITYKVPQLSEEITEIEVVAKFKKAEITLSKKAVNLEIGGKAEIGASITEGFEGDDEITWKSSDEKVATVDENGKVTAVGNGNAKITASILEGKISASCNVTVAATLKSIDIVSPENATTLEVGKEMQLTIKTDPEGMTISDKNIVWTVDKPEIASVSATGKVKAAKAGKVVITASVNNGKLKDTFELTVEEKEESSSSGNSGSSSSSDSSGSSGSSSSSDSSGSESTSSSSSSTPSSSQVAVCDKCGQEKTDACNAAYCTTCASHAGHDASAHCVDCGTVGHASKADAACPQYVAPAETCALCGQEKTDACNAAYCTTCASHAGHDASAHCVDCGTVGHASKADAACSQYVAAESSETVSDTVSESVIEMISDTAADSSDA